MNPLPPNGSWKGLFPRPGLPGPRRGNPKVPSSKEPSGLNPPRGMSCGKSGRSGSRLPWSGSIKFPGTIGSPLMGPRKGPGIPRPGLERILENLSKWKSVLTLNRILLRSFLACDPVVQSSDAEGHLDRSDWQLVPKHCCVVWSPFPVPFLPELRWNKEFAKFAHRHQRL